MDRFDTLLESLTPAQWRERVVHDWTVQDLLGNRRDPDSVPHRVEGDPAVAATLLHAATTLGCD